MNASVFLLILPTQEGENLAPERVPPVGCGRGEAHGPTEPQVRRVSVGRWSNITFRAQMKKRPSVKVVERSLPLVLKEGVTCIELT